MGGFLVKVNVKIFQFQLIIFLFFLYYCIN